jgi:N-acyl homoserine lactone hydrolase
LEAKLALAQRAGDKSRHDDEALGVASIRKLNTLSRSENAELWPNHDFEAYRGWPAFPEWRD